MKKISLIKENDRDILELRLSDNQYQLLIDTASVLDQKMKGVYLKGIGLFFKELQGVVTVGFKFKEGTRGSSSEFELDDRSEQLLKQVAELYMNVHEKVRSKYVNLKIGAPTYAYYSNVYEVIALDVLHRILKVVGEEEFLTKYEHVIDLVMSNDDVSPFKEAMLLTAYADYIEFIDTHFKGMTNFSRYPKTLKQLIDNIDRANIWYRDRVLPKEFFSEYCSKVDQSKLLELNNGLEEGYEAKLADSVNELLNALTLTYPYGNFQPHDLKRLTEVLNGASPLVPIYKESKLIGLLSLDKQDYIGKEVKELI